MSSLVRLYTASILMLTPNLEMYVSRVQPVAQKRDLKQRSQAFGTLILEMIADFALALIPCLISTAKWMIFHANLLNSALKG